MKSVNVCQEAKPVPWRPALTRSEKIPLFRAYPLLEKQLPYVPLANLPSPVEKLDTMGAALGLDRLYIKRDDLNGDIYGSNKVRKLEFLLGDALQAKAKEVITFGFAGSNHALATSVYAGQLGLKSSSMLLPQVKADYVRANLLAGHHFNARLSLHQNMLSLTLRLVLKLLRCKWTNGTFPRIIPAGGTCPLGVIAYINAAFELKQQIDAGEVPEPDCIYVPMGSMGTSAGLILGLKIVGVKSRVIAVRVIEEKFSNHRKMLRLLQKTDAYIRQRVPDFPRTDLSEKDIMIRTDCLGDGYARFTEKGIRAAELMREKSGIILNGTYSAKAFSALIDDAGTQALKEEQTVLYWNTYNSRDLSMLTADIDYHQLPKEFHGYFENDEKPVLPRSS